MTDSKTPFELITAPELPASAPASMSLTTSRTPEPKPSFISPQPEPTVRKLDLSPAAKARLVDLGYEPSLGARPLKRAILRELQNPLAEALLAGGYTGGQTVKVDVTEDKFTFHT